MQENCFIYRILIAVSVALCFGGKRLIVKTETLKTDTRPPVSVKGTRDGLLFLLDEQCDFSDLTAFLQTLLTGDHAGLFSGPSIGVSVDYGARSLLQAETHTLLSIFLQKENFHLQEWGAKTKARQSLFSSREKSKDAQTFFKGTIRAGQKMIFDGDVVVLGDVNPGGEIASTGDVYVFGRLLGVAHAGIEGKQDAIIAAVEFAPMQLRIADVVSRAPEAATGKPLRAFMEFAYLREDGMAVDKISFLQQFRTQR